jgi:hypothetical protein
MPLPKPRACPTNRVSELLAFVLLCGVIAPAPSSAQSSSPPAAAPAAAPAIEANPNPVPASPGLGATTIAWTTGDGSDGVVYVSRNDTAEALFARGPSGSSVANWIAVGSVYEFRLYSTTSRSLLAAVKVPAEAQASQAPTTTLAESPPIAVRDRPVLITAPNAAPAGSGVATTETSWDDGQRSSIGSTGPRYLRAAHWFGEEWAPNFWNTDLESTAEKDFRAIRSDGFNTIILVLPWSGFAPSATSGALAAERVTQLRLLIRLARKCGLGVILRAGYKWSAGVGYSDARDMRAWTDPKIYAGWLDYFGALWTAIGDEPNLLFGFFSWEDLWDVTELGSEMPELRRTSAAATGYRDWLKSNRSLDAVSTVYRSKFSNWEEVPVPRRDEPAFALFFEFIDRAWIEKFFRPTRARFPKLSMEIRVDSDPIWDGPGNLVRWHSHQSAWQLPEAEWTTIYWSPAMGGENRGETLTPTEAATRLRRMLTSVRAVTGARPIFIDQFLVEDFSPGFEQNGRLSRSSVPRFLNEARPILEQFSGGYGLWAWRDYYHNAIANPDFASRWSGWSHSAGAKLNDLPPFASMAGGDWLEHVIGIDDFYAPKGLTVVELCVVAASAPKASTRLTVSDSHANQHLGNLEFGPTPRQQCLDYRPAAINTLRLGATDSIVIRNVRASGFAQPSGIYEPDGTPKPVRAAWRTLNAELGQ